MKSPRKMKLLLVVGWIFWAAVLLFFLMGGHCFGQPPAVVRVYNDFSGERSIGSGTLIRNGSDGGVILTCGHLFSDGTGRISVRSSDGRTVDGQLIAADRHWDLAAIAVPQSSATPLAVATQYPGPGDLLESSGYGPNGAYQTNRGRTLGYTKSGGQQTSETLEFTGAARSGDSGGPIMNERGEVVAVLWGTDGISIMGTYCGRIHKFLSRVLPAGGRIQATGFG